MNSLHLKIHLAIFSILINTEKFANNFPFKIYNLKNNNYAIRSPDQFLHFPKHTVTSNSPCKNDTLKI